MANRSQSACRRRMKNRYLSVRVPCTKTKHGIETKRNETFIRVGDHTHAIRGQTRKNVDMAMTFALSRYTQLESDGQYVVRMTHALPSPLAYLTNRPMASTLFNTRWGSQYSPGSVGSVTAMEAKKKKKSR